MTGRTNLEAQKWAQARRRYMAALDAIQQQGQVLLMNLDTTTGSKAPDRVAVAVQLSKSAKAREQLYEAERRIRRLLES